jgi:hypothetical protein
MEKQFFTMLLPLLAFLLVLAAFRFGVDAMVDAATSQPAAFPTARPFTSQPICGPNNRNCDWQGFDYDWQQPKEHKGLLLPPSQSPR